RRENDRSIHVVERSVSFPPPDPAQRVPRILPQRPRKPGRGRPASGERPTPNPPSTETGGVDASGDPAGGAVGSTTNSRSPGRTELRSAARDAASVPARPPP